MIQKPVGIKLIYIFLWTLFGLSVILFFRNLILGTDTLTLFSLRLAEVDVTAAMRFDSLSTLLLMMVGLLGVVICHYANYYLKGELKQYYFYKNLLGIIVSVSLLVLSSNLLMFFLMWLATSYYLHQLLVYYDGRPQAVAAARKKAVISRIGDLSLLVAVFLTYQVFGSFNFGEIFERALTMSPASEESSYLSLIGFLVVAGAMTKSAQFPFHFWLPETMETPTPVSALMHAGVINAGGFLIIRLSPILQHALAAHMLLTIVGAFTAVFGALCMISQNDIKKKLAYSTMSQMGMMMFACGLGAYGIALFHIFAHSFYKAHAFLSTGYLVEESKKIGFKISQPSFISTMIALTACAALVAYGIYYQEGAYFAVFTYGSVLTLGLLQNIGTSQGVKFNRFLTFTLVSIALIVAFSVYAMIEYSMSNFLQGLVPRVWESMVWKSGQIGVGTFAFIIFISGFWLSGKLMQPNTTFLKKLYIYLWNGGYFSVNSSRILSRIFPSSTN